MVRQFSICLGLLWGLALPPSEPCAAQESVPNRSGSTAGEQAGPSAVPVWTQWRGPERTSLVRSPLLQSLGSLQPLELQWQTPLGPGYSSPIVTENRVFVAETREKKYEVVTAFDRQSGAKLWERQWDGSMSVPFFAKANGDWIRATPIWSEGRLFVGGMRDVLVCLNDRDGSEQWRIDFVQQFGSRLPDFGMVCSPLVHKGRLYVQAGDATFCIDCATGQVVWKSLEVAGNMMSGGAFSSPVIGTLCGVEQLLVQTREELAGVGLEDGKVLWKRSVPTFRGMNILTPLVTGDDRIFTSTYQGGSFLFRVARGENGWTCDEVWHTGTQGYMSSPVLINGHVYLHLRNQRFTCLDLETGKDLWRSDKFGQYWSMIASGDRILALDERGELLLIRANPEKFELLDRRTVADSTAWAHLALAGDQLFVRELDSLQVWKVPGDTPASPAD